MTGTLEEEFCKLVSRYPTEDIRDFLQRHPDVDVNCRDQLGWTALHMACYDGRSGVVNILLKHPNIDVNSIVDGRTPFAFACSVTSSTDVMRLFLMDLRVNLKTLDRDGSTALCTAVVTGKIKVIEWWIALGREMDLITSPSTDKNLIEYAIQVMGDIASEWKGKIFEIVLLLKRFKADVDQTRYELKLELYFKSARAAKIFTLIVLLCDDYLKIKDNNYGYLNYCYSVYCRLAYKHLGYLTSSYSNELEREGIVRFFKIAKQLPMELQMMLCHRVVYSMTDSVSVSDFNCAFRHVIKLFTDEQAALERSNHTLWHKFLFLPANLVSGFYYNNY